jgi:poly-gamma-glutamate synthesis protein (capsule biosynthesis protein)
MRASRRTVLAGLAGLSGCLGVARRGDRSPVDAGSVDARLGFVGDVMLGRSVTDRWEGRNPTAVWGSTLERLERLDGLVLNLECCVSDRGERWPDKTYYFRAAPEFALPALEAAGVSVASLANNHVLDFGAVALRDTRDHLAGVDIAAVGAGPDRSAAVDPAVTDAGRLTVATVAFTDQWPAYAAGESSPGTAYTPLDKTVPSTRRLVGNTLDRAREADPDLVVVSLHWGPNWETEPDATQEAFARWLVDRGADAVHGHSAHVLQGVEVYEGRPILYDCGDFVDDYIHKEGLHNKRSALFELVVREGRLDRLRLVPVEIVDEAVHLADGEGAAWLRETMRERSAPYGTTVERAGDGLAIPLRA